MASSNNHPLPPPPPPEQQAGQFRYQSQQQQQQSQYQQPQYQQPQHQRQQQVQYQQPQQHQPASRSRPATATAKSRSFSFHSEKSGKSHSSRLHETSAEKEAKRLHTKADPTLAMNEAEPSAVQVTERSMLAPLRSIQHRDPFGNPIAEPDRSNPTRSRWERPLDTIRSFEAAIDGGYSSRKSFVRSEADWNRKSGYFGSNGPRFPQESYYGNRPPSQFDPRTSTRDTFFDGGNQYGGYGGAGGYGPGGAGGAGPSRQRASRISSEPQLSSSYQKPDPNPLYPLQHRDRSYETVTSAAGSGSSGDQGSYQTDPSSDNSSVDRASPAKLPPPPTNDYGIGFSQPSTYRPAEFTVGTNVNLVSTLKKKPVGSGALPPPLPAKDMPLQPKPEPQKRKSWLMRRFSKAQ